MKTSFLHPDLGIGGAERLIVDAALALKSKGHDVQIFTNHHDPSHCFEETRDGYLETTVIGDWLPRSFFGRCIALWAYIRMIYAAFYLVFRLDCETDVFIVDQVSACIPLMKWKGAKVVFYCHFPDQLLTQRKTLLKKLYRFPLDWLEEKTTGMADIVLVNSNFTASVFRDTFPSLSSLPLDVVHPSINDRLQPIHFTHTEVKTKASTLFLSINRYERKKDIRLAIDAMGCLQKILPASDFARTHLVVAGGYDVRLPENVEYFEELRERVNELQLDGCVTFLKSLSDEEKRSLLHSCTAVLYTPSEEHFGIVPLEAMLMGRPVIACASGGPLETVLDDQTGFLCEPTADAFAQKMSLLARDRSLAREMGSEGIRHVKKNFSFQRFAASLDAVLTKLQA